MKKINIFNNKKRGFTLIEIIVVIALVAVIGTVSIVGINSMNKHNQEKELKKVTDNFSNALQVYMANHREVEENLVLNSKAAIITLETLKNDGLIADNIKNPMTNEKFDYSNNYFTLLEAKVVDKEEIPATDCENNILGINILKSWDLKNLDTSDVIYVCPRKDYSEDIKSLQDKVNELSSELEEVKSKANDSYTNSENSKDKLKLDTLFNGLTYTAKGVNPNNYVYFEVSSNTSQLAYFPNTVNKGLWRIISINDKNEIELVYNEPVLSNNNLNYTSNSSQWCDSGMDESKKSICTFYQLKHNPTTFSSDKYFKYSDNINWVADEIAEDVNVSGSKKSYLYNSIRYKNWIVKNKYFPVYSSVYETGAISLNSSSSKEMMMGSVNYNQINSSINISESWLFDYKMLLGYANVHHAEDHYYNIYNVAGELKRERRIDEANRCTNSQCTRDKDSSKHLHLTTNQYYPTITLSSKVDLVEPNCADGVIKGSKECPYTLSCTEC